MEPTAYLTPEQRKEGTLTPEEITQLAVSFIAAHTGRAGYTFQSMANRNQVAKQIRKFAPHVKFDKGSIRNQSLDPRYTVEGSGLPDKGLANSRSFYAVLYKLDAAYNW